MKPLKAFCIAFICVVAGFYLCNFDVLHAGNDAMTCYVIAVKVGLITALFNL